MLLPWLVQAGPVVLRVCPCVLARSGGGWGVASGARAPGFLLRAGSLRVGVGPLFGTSSLCTVLARSWSFDLRAVRRLPARLWRRGGFCPCACWLWFRWSSLVGWGAASGARCWAGRVAPRRVLTAVLGRFWLAPGVVAAALWLVVGRRGVASATRARLVAAGWLLLPVVRGCLGFCCALVSSGSLRGWGRFSGFSSLNALLMITSRFFPRWENLG